MIVDLVNAHLSADSDTTLTHDQSGLAYWGVSSAPQSMPCDSSHPRSDAGRSPLCADAAFAAATCRPPAPPTWVASSLPRSRTTFATRSRGTAWLRRSGPPGAGRRQSDSTTGSKTPGCCPRSLPGSTTPRRPQQRLPAPRISAGGWAATVKLPHGCPWRKLLHRPQWIRRGDDA